jgi:hypothetical protein
MLERLTRYSRSPRVGAVFVAVMFVAARIFYARRFHLEFEAKSLDYYMQYIDPKLLRTDLLRSLYYLRDQPPLFNLFLGLILKLFPVSFNSAFAGSYLIIGLGLCLSTYALAYRLGAGVRVAAVLAAGLACAPGTLLYEHWLFYGYPVTALLVATALGLHRTLARGKAVDSALGFGALGMLVLMRGTFHLAVFVATLGAVLLLRRKNAQTILRGALVPAICVMLVYGKHIGLYHGVVIGGLYRGVNLSSIHMSMLSERAIADLQKEGAISAACPRDIHSSVRLDLLLHRGGFKVEKTGVPLLDDLTKSTGATNWHATAAKVVGETCANAAVVLHQRYPEIYGKGIKLNLDRYMHSSDRVWPFLREGDGKTNADKLRAWNKWVDEHIALDPAGERWSRPIFFGLVLGILAPLYSIARYLRLYFKAKKRGRIVRVPATVFVTTFIAGVVLYASSVVVLYSTGDHNRYRAEVMQLAWIASVALVITLSKAALRRARRALRKA